MSPPTWRSPRRHQSTTRRTGTSPTTRLAGRTRAGSTRGQSVVEFALILPVLLLILAGAIDLGRAFYAYVAVENAAKEGALYGARHPLCDGPGSCPNPQNVRWVVANEAANLKLSTDVACRTSAGKLIQPMNDCVNGSIYTVRVTHSFHLITPILGDLLASQLTLGASSDATVLEDAFDPTGLEILVWVDRDEADNGSAIAKVCEPADEDLYYAPCQDSSNRSNYLRYQSGTDVHYLVQVTNSGNVDLTSLSYGFSVNGTPMTMPGGCASRLPKALSIGADSSCSFDLEVDSNDAANDVADHVVVVTGQGLAQGLPTGLTDGSATVKVVPPPKLVVDLKAAPYRLGGDGNGQNGAALYPNGDMSLALTKDRDLDESLRRPIGWLKISVVNQGGEARDFDARVTVDGSTVSLAACAIPATLDEAGQPGDSFVCIFPYRFTSTDRFDFRATATARNARIIGGDPTVRVTTDTCDNGELVVPNLVDDLARLDGTHRTVGDARGLWADAGFTGTLSTSPSSARPGDRVLEQDPRAYTCEDADQRGEVWTR